MRESVCVREREREVVSGHGRKIGFGGHRVVLGEVLEGQTPGSVIGVEFFFDFFLRGSSTAHSGWGELITL